MEPTMEMVPQLMEELEECTYNSMEKPSRALHVLFSLTEHAGHDENRKTLVREENGKLIRVLLDYIGQCEPGSREQYLSLLVLNNVSNVSENKRWIAIDCGGAKELCDLLYQNPSCHLIVIVMMNLIFAHEQIRNEVVNPQSDIDIVGSLSHALKVSCSSVPQDNDAEPQKTRDQEDEELSPETVLWCLLALKNLTRSSMNDDTAAQALIRLGVVPLLLRLVTVDGGSSPADPKEDEESPTFTNDPATWNTDSIQDAALFVLMNVCFAPSSRDFMLEVDVPYVLSLIAEYGQDNKTSAIQDRPEDNRRILDFQRVKARMALSFLVGSVGHFGQQLSQLPRSSSSFPCHGDSVLLVTEVEVELLVELLANTLQKRAKRGPGGYSESAFDVRNVIHCIRYLLTKSSNRVRFALTAGARLNVLLMKALALYAVKRNPSIDADSAESACFSLYLQSEYGFKACYLPRIFGDDRTADGHGRLAVKVLSSYLLMEQCNPAGKHAAQQIIRRIPYLVFKGSAIDLDSQGGHATPWSNFTFEDDLKEATEAVKGTYRCKGARPRDDIFNRPVLRTKEPQAGTHVDLLDNKAPGRSFSSALQAVPPFSFDSKQILHADLIDDIQIANNIARSADGEKRGCYGYWWTWQDTAAEVSKKLQERQDSMLSL